MPTRAQNAKLGIFLVATALLLLFVFVVVAGLTFWEPKHTYYVVSDDSVAGLEVGSPVTMRGVDIGTVDEISLDREDYETVRVHLEVDADVPIPRDAQAFIELSGLTGVKLIDITEGSTEAGVLPPGSVIPLGQTTLEKIEGQAEELAEQAVELLGESQELIKNLKDLSEALTRGLDAERVEAMVSRVEGILSSVDSAADELEATMGESRTNLREILDDIDETSNELQDLLRHSNRILRGNDDDLRSAIRDLRQAARNFEALSRQLRRQPSRLLRSSPPEERELP